MEQRQCNPCRDILIRGIGNMVNTDIRNVANKKGINISDTIKPFLKEIADSFPVEMKEKPPIEVSKARLPYIKSYGNSSKLKRELNNIAAHIGVDVSDLLKVKLCEKMIALPAFMKTAVQD